MSRTDTAKNLKRFRAPNRHGHGCESTRAADFGQTLTAILRFFVDKRTDWLTL